MPTTHQKLLLLGSRQWTSWIILWHATGAIDGYRERKLDFRSRGKKDVQNVNKALAEYIDGGDARYGQ